MSPTPNVLTEVPPAPERTADDAPSMSATIRVLVTPVLLGTSAAICLMKGWLVAGVVLCVLTVACIAIEIAIGWLFVKYALRDHANMFKTMAPLLSNGPVAKRGVHAESARTPEEERREHAIDKAVGFGLTRAAAEGGIGANDLDADEINNLRTNVLEERANTYEWLKAAGEFEEVGLTARDGVRLAAHRLAGNPQTGDWAILCHGYAGTWGSMLQYARHFAQAGYNLLIPDMRAHGNSGGRYIGLGVLDKHDVADWASWLVEQGEAAPCNRIVLFGHSMGAASVCLAAGEGELPREVCAVVADCGFDSSWCAMAHKLKGAGLPVHPTLDLVRLNLMARRGGYDIAAGDVLEALKSTDLPVLVAHGLKDSMDPPHTAGLLYDAAAGEKELLVVPGAAHCQSSLAAPELYWSTVLGFIGRF